MGATLASAVAGWEFPATEQFAARVAAGHAREVQRLRGHPFVLAVAISEFDDGGLGESVELLHPVASLEDGAVRAEAEARVRADQLRAPRDRWRELSVGGAKALAPFEGAPFLAVRKVGDGIGLNSAYVRVAVLPVDPMEPLGLAFVRLVGLDAELAAWFAAVGSRRT